MEDDGEHEEAANVSNKGLGSRAQCQGSVGEPVVRWRPVRREHGLFFCGFFHERGRCWLFDSL
jgi:hypothetical protein